MTTNKGRVVDLLTLLYMSDHWLVLTSPGNQQRVIEWIDEFTFGEEIELEDVTEEKGFVTVIGPRGGEVLRIESLESNHWVEATAAEAGILVYRVGAGQEGAFNVITPSESVEGICSALVEAGAQEIDAEAYEVFRLEAGSPVFGREFGEEVNPLEAGLWEAVSFTKGCYVGQEVVARLNTYEKVKRYLAKLTVEGGPVADAGDSLNSRRERCGQAHVSLSGRSFGAEGGPGLR